MPKLGPSDESVNKVCFFPKHKGKLWVDVIAEDREYVEWVVGGSGPQIKDNLYDYLMDLLEGDW